MGAVKIVRIGLTGGIAAGKSTVSRRLGELGAYIIDYDVLARRVVEPGSPVLEEIAAQFGPQAIGADGTLDRGWMAQCVFGDAGARGAAEKTNAGTESRENAALTPREKLMAIEYPAIFSLAQEAERGISGGVVVHDIPLLVEVVDALPFSFDHIVTVEAPETMRIERMVATRGMSARQAAARIRSQPTETQRRAVADIVIDATEPLPRMLEEADRLYAQFKREAA